MRGEKVQSLSCLVVGFVWLLSAILSPTCHMQKNKDWKDDQGKRENMVGLSHQGTVPLVQ